MEEDRFVELAPDYALGLLEGEELVAFEAHLSAGCEACELELDRMDAVGDALAYAAPLVPVPAGVRDRVLAAVSPHATETGAGPAAVAPPEPAPKIEPAPAAARPLPPHVEVPQPTYAPAPWPATRPEAPVAPAPEGPGARGTWAILLAVLCLVGLAVTGWYAYGLRERIALVSKDLERVTAESQEAARALDVVQSPHLELVPLAGQAIAPACEGRVLWSPDTRKAVLYAFGLPKPPAGKDYQLWVIVGSAPRSAGVFPVDDLGQALFVLAEVPEEAGLGAFAVTLEPAGGLHEPSGPMYLLGAVGAKAH